MLTSTTCPSNGPFSEHKSIMSSTASDVASSALSGGRLQLALDIGGAVADAIANYALSLLKPEKRLELGAWIAVTVIS